MANQKALPSEQAILSRFQELRNEISAMSAKANEMAAESQEHELVLKALEPLDGGRRCYRMVVALILPIHSVHKLIFR
jgi:prefoldin subunit 2